MIALFGGSEPLMKWPFPLLQGKASASMEYYWLKLNIQTKISGKGFQPSAEVLKISRNTESGGFLHSFFSLPHSLR